MYRFHKIDTHKRKSLNFKHFLFSFNLFNVLLATLSCSANDKYVFKSISFRDDIKAQQDINVEVVIVVVVVVVVVDVVLVIMILWSSLAIRNVYDYENSENLLKLSTRVNDGVFSVDVYVAKCACVCMCVYVINSKIIICLWFKRQYYRPRHQHITAAC